MQPYKNYLKNVNIANQIYFFFFKFKGKNKFILDSIVIMSVK